MNSSVDFCCICFDNKKHLLRLFDSNVNNITYFFKLTSCIPEMRFTEMNTQRLVCKICCETIDSAYEFRQKCLRSKTKLLDYISQLHKVSNISVNTCEINKFDFIKTEIQSEKSMEAIIGKHKLCKTVDKDANIKENSESYFETQIKSESSPINLTGDNFMNIENVTVKMEIENENSEEHLEESIKDPLENQDDVTVNPSQNDFKLSVSQIKKTGEIQENLPGNFNVFIKCGSVSNKRIDLEENSDYLEKCTDDLLRNPDDIKIDILNNDTELMGAEINIDGKSEVIEKFSKDYVVPLQFQNDDKTVKDGNLFHKIIERKQKQSSPKKISKLQVCDTDIIKVKKLIEHMRTTTENPYECSVCHKKFSQSYHLTTHMRIHTGDKPYKCETCKKTFNHSSGLSKHMRIHSGEKLYECDICKKKFNMTGNLTKHMITHTEEKPHECDVCKKKFNMSSNLTTHMRIHTGQKLYECKICKKKFSQSGNLNTHMLVHTGDKPHACDICKKTFSWRSSLKAHMIVHTGEKVHECSVCNQKFSQSSNLTKHLRTHAEENIQ